MHALVQDHTSQSEVGTIFQKLQPRLAIATHLSVNEYSIVPILSGIRSTYPTGPLAIAQDFAVWDVSPDAVSQRKVGSLCAETSTCSKLFMAGHISVFHHHIYLMLMSCTLLAVCASDSKLGVRICQPMPSPARP